MTESIKVRRARLKQKAQNQIKIDAIAIAAQLPEDQQMKLHEHSLISLLGISPNESFLRLVNNDDSLSQTTKAAANILVKLKALRVLIKSSCQSFEKYKKDKEFVEKIESEIHGYFKNRGGWVLETQDGTTTQFYVKTVHKEGVILRTFVMLGMMQNNDLVVVKSVFDSITKKPIGSDDVIFCKTIDDIIVSIK